MNTFDWIRFFLIALIGAGVMMFLLTGCVSQQYLQKRIREVRENKSFVQKVHTGQKCKCGSADHYEYK